LKPHTQPRISSIDTLRVVAIFCVVGIHAFALWLLPTSYDWVQLFNRFAVPFFFIASGYFFTQKSLAQNKPLAQALNASQHLLLLFFVWSCVYALAPALIPKNWVHISQNGLLEELNKQFNITLADFARQPIFYFFQGPGFHLWFLPALICAQLLLAFALRFKQIETFMLLAAALFIFALLAKPYANLSWGIHTAFDARNGPFFSTPFVAMGAWLAYKNIKPRLSIALIVFLFGFGLQFFEGNYLHSMNKGMPVAGNDFVVGTALLGLGAMLGALALPTLGSYTKLHFLAPYGLGVYLIHILVRDFLEPISNTLPLYGITWTIATFSASASMVFVMSKIPILRKIVS
jgi:surface polysaccharide O-acyltransferase-like enzyme